MPLKEYAGKVVLAVNVASKCGFTPQYMRLEELYKWLTAQKTRPEGAGNVSWNFNKFLVNRSGQAVYRFGSRTEPLAEELVKAVEKLLAEQAGGLGSK